MVVLLLATVRSPHLSGFLMAMCRSTAMANRLKMELWVRTSTRQAIRRQLWKSVHKPTLEEEKLGLT